MVEMRPFIRTVAGKNRELIQPINPSSYPRVNWFGVG